MREREKEREKETEREREREIHWNCVFVIKRDLKLYTKLFSEDFT